MRRITITVLGLALALAACGGSGTATTAAPAATGAPATTAASSGGAEVAMADSALGSILVDGSGRTLYLFKPDAQGASTCNDQCAANWPALTGPATAGTGVDGGLLGTTTRTDGTVQVTYNGWPLYHFAGDAAAGNTNGQGINDVWYVVSAAGDAIE